MDVIHFTRGATDPVTAPNTHGTWLVPLADSVGATHVGCVHLDPGAHLTAPDHKQGSVFLVVHGRLDIWANAPQIRLRIHAGMGVVLDANEAYSFESPQGAIVLLLESKAFLADACGISTPQRIEGQRWPSDALLSD